VEIPRSDVGMTSNKSTLSSARGIFMHRQLLPSSPATNHAPLLMVKMPFDALKSKGYFSYGHSIQQFKAASVTKVI
jgi:hypothetical protein